MGLGARSGSTSSMRESRGRQHDLLSATRPRDARQRSARPVERHTPKRTSALDAPHTCARAAPSLPAAASAHRRTWVLQVLHGTSSNKPAVDVAGHLLRTSSTAHRRPSGSQIGHDQARQHARPRSAHESGASRERVGTSGGLHRHGFERTRGERVFEALTLSGGACGRGGGRIHKHDHPQICASPAGRPCQRPPRRSAHTRRSR